MSKNKPCLFTGACTALVTPFIADGSAIDYEALSGLIEEQIHAGVDALLIAGTTGEAPTLTWEEYRTLADFAVNHARHRVPIIMGCGSNSTQKAIALARYAADAGADGILCVVPYYNKPTPEGMIAHFTAVADAAALPMLLYNIPARTGAAIPLSVYRALSQHPNIIGVKEASNDIAAMSDLLAECRDDFDVYAGSDEALLPLLSLGGRGVISVLSGLLPAQVHKICSLYFDGKVNLAAALFRKYLPLCRALFSVTSPIPIKTALSLGGKCAESFRLPLCRMSPESVERNALRELLVFYGLPVEN